MFDAVVITCEHGGNRVPARYRALFAGHAQLLNSHRGFDPGALELAQRFAKAGAWPLHFATTTRLLIELNRSSHHRALFSAVTRLCDAEVKAEIVRDYYEPYRQSVQAEIEREVLCGRRVLHLSVHSFTPELNGEIRRADIGLLYDPRRNGEVAFCDAWRSQLRASRPELTVRRNYPYLGSADGFTTALRKRFPAKYYVGVELEVNQRRPLAGGAGWKRLQQDLVTTLLQTLNL
jgi:predicted N-formylglutamate amidohydrolase